LFENFWDTVKDDIKSNIRNPRRCKLNINNIQKCGNNSKIRRNGGNIDTPSF